MSNAPFYIYRPTKPIGSTNVSEDALPWVYDQDPSSGFCARMLVVPADALEAADKRIAELEKYGRVQDPLADRIAELERKLAVAREALNSIAKNTCCGDCQEAKRVAQEYLAQIGGKDAGN